MFGTPAKQSPRRLAFPSVAAWFQRGRAGAADGALWRKSDYGVWSETLNPLRGLTAQRAQDIFDRSRRGVYAELAWLYQEIEAADPTLFICCERREAATSGSDWRIALANPGRAAGWEDTLANEQRDYLERAYGAAGDEIGAAAEHLSRGFFRGFAHARPVFGADGLDGFELYDQWNFARDPATGSWWWNPDAATVANERFAAVPAGELVTLERSRHIDYPALAVFIRAALGERKWGIFLERYGIPPVTVVMPEFADKGEETAYMEAAEKVARGGSGAIPFGASVSYATEARGTNPFSEFLRHQQEHVVMLATGGLLTTLAAPGSGTLAGNAHEETWRAVVARDIRVVARAFNRTVTRRLLAARFPGRPALAMIEFDPDPAPTAGEVFEDAGKAKAAGYRVEQGDLENRTGYKLVEDTAALVPPFAEPAAPPSAPEASAAAASAAAGTVAETAMNGAQVAALLDIIAKVASGEIELDTAPAVIKAAFPLLSDEQIAAMLPDKAVESASAVPPIVANKPNPLANPLQPLASGGSAAGTGGGEAGETPPLNGAIGGKDAKRPDPLIEALKAIEAGATTDEALDAYDAAAAAALDPAAVAARAEAVAAELDAAAAEGKEGK